jgi:hypothetical protein
MAQQPIGKDTLAREKRDASRRARRLALTLLAEADKARLTQFADELDKEAAALELSTFTVVLPPVVAPHQQVQQQQVQQQQSAESPASPQVAKEKD